MRSCGRGGCESTREGALPPSVLVDEGAGQAVLPLRRRQGLTDGVHRDGADHRDVDRARRRARPEGRPDDHDLRPTPRVVLLLPVRAAARGQAARAHAAGHDRDPNRLPDPAVAAAVLRPQPGAPARAPADRHGRRHPDDLRHGLPHLPRRGGGLTELDRSQGRPSVRGRQARRGPVGVPGLPQDRRERQIRPRAESDRDRRSAAAGGDPADGREPDVPDALLPRPARPEEDRSGRVSRAAQARHAHAGRVVGSDAARSGTLPEGQVRAMFDRIAGFYDAMNSVMTVGLHHRWRARAADLAAVGPGDRALDVATGTGDLAIELARRVGPSGEVIGSDFSEEMLTLARRKAPALRFEFGNALELPYADDSFDAVTVGFGARNFSDLERGLSEMARVVRPGGRVVVLEITTPTKPPLSTFYGVWFDRLLALLGRLGGDSDAYTYLPSSVRRFPGPPELAATMDRAGLE